MPDANRSRDSGLTGVGSSRARACSPEGRVGARRDLGWSAQNPDLAVAPPRYATARGFRPDARGSSRRAHLALMRNAPTGSLPLSLVPLDRPSLPLYRPVHTLRAMKPLLVPLAAQVGRLALRRKGVLSRSVATAFGPLHAYDAHGWGDLPTTVLLHGLGSAATPFGALLERLRRDTRRVVAPDYPGHGFSKNLGRRLTPDALFESVGAALDSLLDEPAIVVGHSLGGAVALHYALARPDRVRSLVLVSPAGARASEEEWRSIKGAFDVVSASEARALLERLYHRQPWFLPLLARDLPAMFQRRAVRDLLETANNEHAASPDALGSLSMPVLLLWGKSERLLPQTHFEYFVRHLPGHAVVEQPDRFGHCPHLEEPAALAGRIVQFARSNRLSRSRAA